MKIALMRDANKIDRDPSRYKTFARKIKQAEYEIICLNETQFRNLVFMGTNDYVWLSNWKLVNKLTPDGESRTLQDVVNRIVAEYRYDSPIEIFKHLSEKEPWFDGCFIASARFDYRLLGELKIRRLTEEEKKDSPCGSFYLEDGNHRALVYLVFLCLGAEEYKPVRAIVSKDWAHIFPWATKSPHQ